MIRQEEDADDQRYYEIHKQGLKEEREKQLSKRLNI
jgi:hypothetical protein